KTNPCPLARNRGLRGQRVDHSSGVEEFLDALPGFPGAFIDAVDEGFEVAFGTFEVLIRKTGPHLLCLSFHLFPSTGPSLSGWSGHVRLLRANRIPGATVRPGPVPRWSRRRPSG